MECHISLRRFVLSLLLASGPAFLPAAVTAAETAPAVNPERLWLPASSAHLMPMLEYAAGLALSNPDCQQVLYGRLNEFRSDRGEEPVLTILCQQDSRTTFNVVYQASDLESALDTIDTEFSEENPANNLEALRQLLMSNAELREHNRNRPEESDSDTATTQSATDDLDLELELEDLLRERTRPSEAPPELF